MDNLPDAIYFKDRESRFTRINKALAKQFGLSDPVQALGKTDFDFFTPEHAQTCYDDEQRIIRTGQPLVGAQEKETWQDGYITWASTTKMPLRDAHGNITGTFGISRDITERKVAEEELRESEERFRATFEDAGIGMALVDAQGRPTKSNTVLRQMLGYSEEELARMPFTEYTYPADKELDWGFYCELTQGKRERYEMEKRFIKKGGEVVWGMLTVSLVKGLDGRPICAVGMAQDITERKRAESALRESEERYRALFERNLAGVFVTTWDGRVLDCNQAMANFLGFKSRLEAKAIRVTDLYYSQEERAEFLARLEAEGRLSNYEVRLRRQDGKLVWLIGNISTTTDTASGVRIIEGTLIDVSDRKLVEAENARLAQIVNSSEDAIFSATPEGIIATWNAGAERMFGYTAEEIKGKHFSVLIPREHRVDLAGYQERLRGGEALVHNELEHLRKDGSKFPVFLTLSPMIDANGEFTGVSVIARDITKRKQAEEALRESEERFRSLVQNATVGIYRTTPDGRILMANPSLIKMLGYSNFKELAARDLSDCGFAPGYSRKAFQERIEREGEVKGLETAWKRLGGSVTYVRESARAVRGESGKVLYYDGIVEDITDRKQAEAEHVRLVTAIEQSAEAVLITDTHGNIKYVNPAFTRITGYRREEAVGQNPRILKSGKQDSTSYQQLWETILKGETWQGELTNRRKDGSLYTEQMSITPVRSEHDEITHFIATKQDITERKALEGQLQQASKMEAVGRLAGGVAHDFNNLLTVINGYSELLLADFSPDTKTSGYLKEIIEAGVRAASLTRQLLAFSRHQVLNPQVLDLNTLVSNMEKMLRRLIGEDIILRTVLAPALGQVMADPGQVEQVLMNLAVNARDAMPMGGHLTLETRNVELDQDYGQNHPTVKPGPYVMVAVADTGVGMTLETKARIFEPFFTTKEIGKGTGLGLATVYGIVKQSGGSIWVYSEPGQGTVFKVYFPMVSGTPKPTTLATAETDSASGTETILLVEDEEGVRSLVRAALMAGGYDVLETEDAEKAIALCASHPGPIDLLLTDVIMPEMSGPIVANKIAALRPGIKVLYMSGYTDDAVLHHGVVSQEMPFIQKPFSTGELRKKIREVLGG